MKDLNKILANLQFLSYSGYHIMVGGKVMTKLAASYDHKNGITDILPSFEEGHSELLELDYFDGWERKTSPDGDLKRLCFNDTEMFFCLASDSADKTRSRDTMYRRDYAVLKREASFLWESTPRTSFKFRYDQNARIFVPENPNP